MKRLRDTHARALHSRRDVLKTTLYAAFAAAAPITRAVAADYPQKPIQYVSPYPPGGTNDLVARIVSKHLAGLLGTSIIVENRGGAGGTIGTGYAAHANADGYTVLNASSGNLTSAPQVIGAPYHPLADLVPRLPRQYPLRVRVARCCSRAAIWPRCSKARSVRRCSGRVCCWWPCSCFSGSAVRYAAAPANPLRTPRGLPLHKNRSPDGGDAGGTRARILSYHALNASRCQTLDA
ncbi:hypothetical protein QFZ39_005183 [Paraburkholderia graminis]|nr:hypothetical protein [Paraburkholderia graminis]